MAAGMTGSGIRLTAVLLAARDAMPLVVLIPPVARAFMLLTLLLNSHRVKRIKSH
jgi:hypothetical protein